MKLQIIITDGNLQLRFYDSRYSVSFNLNKDEVEKNSIYKLSALLMAKVEVMHLSFEDLLAEEKNR